MTEQNRVVLSVDDNEDDNFLLRRAFAKNGASVDLRIVNDGQEAIDLLMHLDPAEHPDLILLDLKMPRKDGFAVLDWIHQQPLLSNLQVAVFTSSQGEQDIRRAYQKGAAWYLVKPVALDDLVELAGHVEQWLATGGVPCLTSSASYRPPVGETCPPSGRQEALPGSD
jgi:CheY-like chemotaxis protein